MSGKLLYDKYVKKTRPNSNGSEDEELIYKQIKPRVSRKGFERKFDPCLYPSSYEGKLFMYALVSEPL